MKETSLWKWLKKAITQSFELEKIDLNRIENEVGSGMPDVEGHLYNQFWIELKVYKRPVRPTTKIKPKFRPAQVPWLTRRWEAGGNAWVLLQVGSGHEAKRYLIPGYMSSMLEKGMLEKEIQRLATNISPEKVSAIDILELASNYRKTMGI